jgi:two-component system heavy metal sensor histidine kinase CusS
LRSGVADVAIAAGIEQFVNSFNSTLERVEQAYSRLESFNADVAHELRSPLTNLIGQTQVALTRGRSAEHYFEVLQSNLEELERLRSIINTCCSSPAPTAARRQTDLHLVGGRSGDDPGI